MVKTYTHIKSGNSGEVIQYDGSIVSLHEIAESFDKDIIFSPSGIYIDNSILKLGYYIVQSCASIYVYPENIFKALYTERVEDREFKLNASAIRDIWSFTLRYSNLYTIRSLTNEVSIKAIDTGLEIRISNVISIRDPTRVACLSTIAGIIIKKCEEICI